MGPVPGSETQISRKKSLNFLIGVRIFDGKYQPEMISLGLFGAKNVLWWATTNKAFKH